MTLGEKIRTIRKQKGISQEELAAMVYTKKQTISLYEKDKLEMKVSMLKNISQALGIPARNLIEDDKAMIDEDSLCELADVAEIYSIIKNMKSKTRKVALEQIRALYSLDYCL